MEKKNQVKAIFVLCSLVISLAILLCAAPRCWAVSYSDGGEHKVEEDLAYLEVGAGTTVHLDASVEIVYLYAGSVLNIYSGSVKYHIALSIDEPYAKVTVYGTNFALDGDSVNPGQVPIINGVGVLTVTYEGTDEPVNLKFFSNIPIYLVETAVNEVEIDIKPGSNPNSINLKSRGVVPVAVFTIASFNAGAIDPGTVLFAGAKPVRCTLKDVDDDGDMDMLFHFKTQDMEELKESSTEATLTGTTFGGENIELTDEVRIVPSKK